MDPQDFSKLGKFQDGERGEYKEICQNMSNKSEGKNIIQKKKKNPQENSINNDHHSLSADGYQAWSHIGKLNDFILF